MTSRADKLGRIVSLVKLQLRLSEWQLAHLRQQEQTLRDEQASRQLDQVRSESRRVKQLEEVAKAALADKLRDAEKRSLEEITGTHPAVRDWTPRPASRNKT